MALPTRKKVFDVVGESAVNADGTRRQDLLCEIDPGEAVLLVREPNNTYDLNAVAVQVGGHTIGYLRKDDAASLAPYLDSLRPHRAIVHSVRGGVPGATHYGCEVSIAWDDAPPHAYKPLDQVQL